MSDYPEPATKEPVATVNLMGLVPGVRFLLFDQAAYPDEEGFFYGGTEVPAHWKPGRELTIPLYDYHFEDGQPLYLTLRVRGLNYFPFEVPVVVAPGEHRAIPVLLAKDFYLTSSTPWKSRLEEILAQIWGHLAGEKA